MTDQGSTGAPLNDEEGRGTSVHPTGAVPPQREALG
jgi:hypothetical protein